MASVINASSSGAGGLVSSGDSSGVLQLQNNGSTSVTLDTSGNVGIGTSSPNSKLNVNNGFLQIDIAGTQTVRLGSTDSIVGGTDNNTVIQTGTSKALLFLAGPTERMRIDSSGNLTINTGTLKYTNQNGVSTPSANGQGSIGTYNVYGTSITGQGSAYDITFFNRNLSVAGYVATGSTTITTSSDERLKENLQPITNALDTVKNLRTVTGNYKSDPSRNVAFFIAQDMEQHFPQAFEGANPDAYGINYNWTNPLLAAAIKEQQALITAQAETINALTARIVALEQA